jgi:ferredoxin/flavodoxin
MKCAIFYFSSTGNTKLVVEHLVRRLGVSIDLCDIARRSVPDLNGYDIAGFASPVERMAEPPIVQEFMRNLPPARGKPAFLLATYGAIAGRVLDNLSNAATARGFRVVESHALHVPESYPPMIAVGLDSSDQPDPRHLREFDDFIDRLKAAMTDLAAGQIIEEYIPHQRLRDTLAPKLTRDLSPRTMGPKLVDEKLCNKCGICVGCCPYKAVLLDPLPAFNENLCRSCWACYNLCPEKAIYTRMLRGKGHYPGPTEEFKRRLAG